MPKSKLFKKLSMRVLRQYKKEEINNPIILPKNSIYSKK
jgi:hypothetical protein